MGYDINYAAPVAASNAPYAVLKQAVDDYTQELGIASSKIVLALPWYGYDWTCVNALTPTDQSWYVICL